MAQKKKSGDPRKIAAVKAADEAKRNQTRHDKIMSEFIDDLLEPEVAERAEMLARNFIESRPAQVTEEQSTAIKRYFLTIFLSLSTLRMAEKEKEGSLNFVKIAKHVRLDDGLHIEILAYLKEQGLITYDQA